ncbi:putative signal recognition particle 68 kda protein [Phaeoacremonium minimum UCRPA7]|uniref:Signal recognition particle subunit SRP68 n=1 Tax=Phaeoacremonium minimum (strain UCR-PA7) TaxID=1286976 RepID=R8BED6_PHAM7|nr:putative signal recognition particle 68 kda protein [Phaeoacremonium minimum UCRPA7]EON97645.1 putative signal recognition particle 68 kda protein [Phaeoacremonium minimum UCRPA7]
MDITKFVVSSREQALLYGDYATYRSQLANRLLSCRKKLHIVTKNRGKYNPKVSITPEQVAENHAYVDLLLLTSERAWAHAMAMKSIHSADTKGISGHTRSHMVSRLEKAAKAADRLVEVLSDGASGASEKDVLEARAYAALLRGSSLFEKQSWQACLGNYSIARVIYSALSSSTKGDIYKDLLSETIDPSIRYAAYQLKTPRTLPIPAIARQSFPQNDKALVSSLEKLDPNILKQADQEVKKDDAAPKTLTWRSREVHIEDAAIALAWGSVEAAKDQLSDKLSSSSTWQPKDKAAAYDDVLLASQDAVDATKQAIDELRSEGISQGDARMQSLQITRTAVNYEMISYRIGRNRVLAGDRDGALVEFGPSSKKRKLKEESVAVPTKEQAPGRQVARLKEKVVLYDGTLQSLESIKELPGVAADEELSGQLDAAFKYFNALKCLALARSHTLTGHPTNALALIKYAFEQCESAMPVFTKASKQNETSIRSLDVTQDDAKFVYQLLQGELQRSRALVEIASLRKQNDSNASKPRAYSLIDRLNEYPSGGVDLENILVYPPKIETVPVKPLFLDVAWNYIGYPDNGAPAAGATKQKTAEQPSESDKQPQKRGWFGFGR